MRFALRARQPQVLHITHQDNTNDSSLPPLACAFARLMSELRPPPRVSSCQTPSASLCPWLSGERHAVCVTRLTRICITRAAAVRARLSRAAPYGITSHAEWTPLAITTTTTINGNAPIHLCSGRLPVPWAHIVRLTPPAAVAHPSPYRYPCLRAPAAPPAQTSTLDPPSSAHRTPHQHTHTISAE